MSFDLSWRWAAFPPEMLANYGQMLEAFGEVASDGKKEYPTLLCGWDDEGQTRLRAMSLTDDPPTVAILPLTDGRVAVGGLWTKKIVKAWQDGGLPGVEELTDEALQKLRPKEEI